LIAISKTVQQRIKEIYGRDSIVIYPPVEVDRFKGGAYCNTPLQSGDRASVRSDFFLSVGRLIPYKRVDLLVKTFNKTGQKLKIVGTGPEKEKLQKIAKKNIEFLGSVSNSERDNLYLKAKGFIFPAEEDFGIVPVEAMAAGTPVIAYKKGGATETVKEGVSGIFFPEQNSESLIQALKKFEKINFDPRMVSNSVQDFNPNKFQQQIKKVVNSVM